MRWVYLPPERKWIGSQFTYYQSYSIANDADIEQEQRNEARAREIEKFDGNIDKSIGRYK